MNEYKVMSIDLATGEDHTVYVDMKTVLDMINAPLDSTLDKPTS